MEKLKIGDKVCLIDPSAFHHGCDYIFAKVDRLTKDHAILDSWSRKIKNKPTKNAKGEDVFIEVSSRREWFLSTPKIEEDAKKEAEKLKIDLWFRDNEFSDEDKKNIYYSFVKNEPILSDTAKKKLNFINGHSISRDFPNTTPSLEWVGAVLDLINELKLDKLFYDV